MAKVISPFENAVNELDVQENRDLLDQNIEDTENSIDSIIKKIQYHPSILMINKMITVHQRFDFSQSTEELIKDELSHLNPKKATTFKNIPCKLLKSNIETCAPILTSIYNKNVSNSSFPDKMKVADITPVHKKDEVTNVKKLQTS